MPSICTWVVAIGGIAAGCVATSNPATESWTSRPGPQDDGGASDGAGQSADARPPMDPPEQVCTLTGRPVTKPGDELVFGDDFNGTTVDATKWGFITGKTGPTTVINTVNPTQVSVSGGSLFIKTDRAPADPTYPYVSGYVQTLGKYARTYGKVEFRARVPQAMGVWYALWGRPWFERFPEMDIELLNQVKMGHTQLYFVDHWGVPLPTDPQRAFSVVENTDFSQFHTYTILWTPDAVEWAIDGVTKLQTTTQGVPTKPVYWIMSGWVGGWADVPPDTTVLPSTAEVDFVHVYRVDGLIAAPEIKVANPATTYAKTDSIQIAIANFDEVCTHVEVYEGDSLLWTTSTAPLHFKLSQLGSGPHKLTFVATDGDRRTSTELDTQIK